VPPYVGVSDHRFRATGTAPDAAGEAIGTRMLGFGGQTAPIDDEGGLLTPCCCKNITDGRDGSRARCHTPMRDGSTRYSTNTHGPSRRSSSSGRKRRFTGKFLWR
jgi:hypothetical protein